MLDASEEEITNGDIPRVLVVLAIPLLVQNLVQVTQQMVDLFWLGRYSSDALAALGIAMPLVVALFAVVIAAPVIGTLTVVSQRVGEDGADDPAEATMAGVVLVTVFGVAAGVATLVVGDALVPIVTELDPTAQAEAAVIENAVLYVQIIAIGVVIGGAANVIEVSFVGWGKTKLSLAMNVVALLVNAVLDPLFIFDVGPVPGYGLAGAAVATVIGYVAGLAVGIGLAVAVSEPILSGGTHPAVGTVREVFSVGAPQSAKELVQQGSQLLAVVLVFGFAGSVGVAAYIIGDRVASFARIPVYGLKQSIQSMVGQNVGANNPDRARSTTATGVIVSAGALAVLGAAQFVLTDEIVAVLMPAADAVTTETAADFLRILVLGYPAIGVFYALQGGFDGARRTDVSFYGAVVQGWILLLPIAWLAHRAVGIGAHAVFWAYAVSYVGAAIVLGAYYLGVRDELMGGPNAAQETPAVDRAGTCHNCGTTDDSVSPRPVVPDDPSADAEVALCRSCAAARRAGGSGQPDAIPVDRNRVFERNAHECRACGDGRSRDDLELHPVVPLDTNGYPHEYNVVPLCRQCYDTVQSD